jgi:hypothetical protein
MSPPEQQRPAEIISQDGIETDPAVAIGPPPTQTAGLVNPNPRRDLFAERELEKAPEVLPPPKHRPITLGKPVPVEKRAPTSSYFAKLLSAGYNIRQSESDQIIIAVQPRMSDWILPFSRFVQNEFHSTEFEKYRRVSPQTLMAYFFFTGILRLLLLDLRSPVPSSHAKGILRNPTMYTFVRNLMNLSIPSAIAEVFENICPAALSGPFKVLFVPSLAGFMHTADFRTFIYPPAFLAMHNQIGYGALTKRSEIDLFKQVLYTVAGTNALTIRVGNFFSKYVHTGNDPNAGWYRNPHWLSTAIDGLTVPFTNRYNVRRPQFATIPIGTPVWNGQTSNPYTFLLTLSDDEIHTTFTWLSELNLYVAENFSDSVYIEDTLTTDHNGIYHHYLSGALLPGSSLATLGLDATPTAEPTIAEDLDFSRYREQIHFGSAFNHGTGNHTTLDPAANVATLNLYYGSGSTTAPSLEHREFDYFKDYLQPIRLFSPTADTVLAHHRTLISGIMIENGNVDGVSIPLVNPLEHLMSWKSRLMNVALRADKILSSFTTNRPLFDRPIDTDIIASSMTIILNQKENRLAKTGSAYVGTHPHDGYFAIKENWNGTTPPVNVITRDSTTNTAGKIKPDFWSSYRWIVPGQRGVTNTYMIPTLHHIFGLAAETSETEQLFKLLHA